MLRAGTALLSVATTLALTAPAHAAVWRVPLERHDVGAAPRHTAAAHRQLEKATAVWEPRFPQFSGGGEGATPIARGPVPVDFRDISANIFATTFLLGTPPQPVSLVMDLGSSDLCVLNHAIGAHTYYDHAKSSTYAANGTQVKLFDGQPFQIDGLVSRDVVALGATSGGGRLDVPDQVFVELTGPDAILGHLPPKFSGVMGFGHTAANLTGAPSLLRAMIDQELLDRPQVGLVFGEVVAHAIFGGIDAAYTHDDFHFFEQQHTPSWSAPVSRVLVNGAPILADIGRAMLESVDISAGPADEIDALADAVGAENYALPCDDPGPDITLQFGGGFNVTLTKKDYTIPCGQGWCMLAFIPLNTTQWTLGMPFLRKVYTMLDFGASEGDEQIGFALIKA